MTCIISSTSCYMKCVCGHYPEHSLLCLGLCSLAKSPRNFGLISSWTSALLWITTDSLTPPPTAILWIRLPPTRRLPLLPPPLRRRGLLFLSCPHPWEGGMKLTCIFFPKRWRHGGGLCSPSNLRCQLRLSSGHLPVPGSGRVSSIQFNGECSSFCRSAGYLHRKGTRGHAFVIS